MRRTLLLLAPCAAVVLALAPVAQAQEEAEPGTVSDLACVLLLPEDSSNPEDAQAGARAILEADPSDPNGLDADGDGVACEFEASSTGEVSFEDGSGFVADYASPAPQQYEPPSSDLDCADFGSNAEAQAALDADPTDPSDIDADGDGIACEELFSAPPTQAAPPTQTDVPAGPEECEEFVAQTGSRINCDPLQEQPAAQESPTAQTTTETPDELPATGGPDLALPLSTGALLLTGLGVLALASRHPARP